MGQLPIRLGACLLGWAAIALFASGVRAQSTPEVHARLQLVSEAATIPANGPVWVGVLFRLDEGWHIYWKNPGDSGEPPKIVWRLPAGWSGGAIRWPRPIVLGRGSIRDYGYEGQVLLMTALQPKDSVTAPVEIGAAVKYLVCREICIPEKANLTLSLPGNNSSNTESSEWRTLFQQTRAQLPKPLPPSLKVTATSAGRDVVLMLEGAAGTHEMRFFPLEPGIIENSAPQSLTSNGRVTRLTIRKSEQLGKPLSTLRGVIVLGGIRSYRIDIPVGLELPVD
jgi:DsbC/DsbD-like thiol-disulfide interchange protein